MIMMMARRKLSTPNNVGSNQNCTDNCKKYLRIRILFLTTTTSKVVELQQKYN